jgi:hypothetical protein
VGATEITSTWSGNTGNWTDPTQWSTNPNYPNNGTPSGTTYDAVINAPGAGPHTVTLNSNVTTDSVTLDFANATLSQTGGTLTTSTFDVAAGTYVLTGGSLQIDANGPLGLSPSLVNAGTIRATGGGTLSFGGTNFNNSGGTMVVDPYSELLINPAGTVTPAQVGNIVNNGGTVMLGGALNNSGNTLTFGGSMGTWMLSGIVQSGTVDLPSTTVLEDSQFEDVTLACDLTLNVNFGSISFDDVDAGGHTINIFGSEASLFLGGSSQTLSNIVVNLGGSTNNAKGGYLPAALALDTTAVVNGWGGIGFDGNSNFSPHNVPNLLNQGVITANVPGETLQISPLLLTNTGILAATGGGILAVSPGGSTTWTNNGILAVDNLSTITVNQSLSFADGSAFDAVLGSNGASGILSIAGNLDLSGDEFLNLSLAPGAVFSTPYEIASYTGALTGTFENVTPGFVVDYSQPGEILVTAVPEPSICALLGGGACLVLGRRRRRDKSRCR